MKVVQRNLLSRILSCNGGLAMPSMLAGRAVHGKDFVSRILSTNYRTDDPNRRFFDKMTRDSDAVIDDAQDAVRLFEAAISFADSEGAPKLLYRLVDQTAINSGALRKALEHIDATNPTVFKLGFLPFLELLGGDELNKPVYQTPLNTILSKMYSFEFIVPQIKAHLEEGIVESSIEKTSLVWFFTKVALTKDEARNDKKIHDIAEFLSATDKKVSESLINVLEGHNIDPSLSALRLAQQQQPGGRHDNDFSDFRSIQTLPTQEEFMCTSESYLPKSTMNSPMTTSQLLDRHFRLLREDMIAPSKEELLERYNMQKMDVVYKVHSGRIETGAAVYREESGNSTQVIKPTDPCISFSLDIPKWHRLSKIKDTAEKAAYWEKNQRALPRDALVALLRKNSANKWIPIRFGIIKRREIDELAKQRPTIGISFFNEKNTADTIKEIFDGSINSARLMVVSSQLFAYTPILKGLKSIETIPFQTEILNQKPSEEMDYSPSIPEDIKTNVEKLDSAQRAALEKTLKSRVSLIHGPPGTGKSSVGALIAQSIVASTNETVLCVCYTNHALDDFLENLLDAGISDIVRLGGRSKNARLDEYNLREKAASDKIASEISPYRYAQVMSQIEEAEAEVARLQTRCETRIGSKSWLIVGTFLKDAYTEAWLQLRVDPSYLSKKVEDDHLWKQWIKGKTPTAPFPSSLAKEPLWQLSKTERKKQKMEWQHELFEEDRRKLAITLTEIEKAKAERKQLIGTKNLEVLKSTRVIGCTTTKAAMTKDLLDDVSPGVILVEEAGEILEAHILTSLNPSTKHLIMIGDHKQLRPKVQHYPLTVESGRGFDLNKSLFERLANVLPTFNLNVQHRMHPEISQIPKLISYPELKDAPSVNSHPRLKGLRSRVIFVDHNVQEDKSENMSDKLESTSKTNQHEVEMVVCTVRYLLQQGYNPNDLVVLTPYLGQLWKIQEALSAHVNVLLGDLDYIDVRSSLRGVNGFNINKKPKDNGLDSPVRVATVDNYQGEEANVAIISLVRGNPENKIGFCKEPERVNVMFSRAKHGQIIFGNLSTLCNAPGSETPLRGGNLWRRISDHLQNNGQIFNGLPTGCQLHGNGALLSRPEDFVALCPDGGCDEVCGKLLDCGHPCQKRCHVGPCGRCHVLVEDRCPQGHKIFRKCGFDRPKCRQMINWRCPQGHLVWGVCFNGKYSEPCKDCLKLQKKNEAMIIEENNLQKELEKKEKILQVKKNLLARKQREKIHQDQLKLIEAEVRLAEDSLHGSFRSELKESEVAKNIKDLLCRQKGYQTIASRIPELYLRQYGITLKEGVQAEYGGKFMEKNRIKVANLCKQLPFCEVEAQKGTKMIRLRADHIVRSNGEVCPADEVNCDGGGGSSEKATLREHGISGTATVIDASIDAKISHILGIYRQDGPTAADNAIDKMICEEFDKELTGIKALRSIIHSELDPQGEMQSIPMPPDAHETALSNAICSWATALSLPSNFPLKRRELALDLINFHELSEHKIIPGDWISKCEHLVREAESPPKPVRLRQTSSVSEKWHMLEKQDHKAPKVVRESILPMIGLESVKENILNSYYRIKLAQEQNDDAASSYNVRFEGNPGTGKTTICRHYGKFLQQLSVLPKGSTFSETSGSKLIHDGVSGLQTILQEAKSGGGGVIFVDEAYQLVSDREGKKILDYILPLAESLESGEFGKLVWVFAGYRKPMEEMFMHNEGLPSRFPHHFIFEDYKDEELQSIFQDLMEYKAVQSGSAESSTPKKSTQTTSLSFYGEPENRSTRFDRNGHRWLYKTGIGWKDEVGNRTVDPDMVGTESSPVVGVDGRMWTEDSGKWTDEDGNTIGYYPGTSSSNKRERREHPFHCNPDHLMTAIKRLGRRRGDTGFGNARAVRALFDQVRDRQAARLAREREEGKDPDIFWLNRFDLLGPNLSQETLKNSEAWRELESLEGLTPVKQSVQQLFSVVFNNIQREERGEPPYDVTLNRLFLGNPGTGKTTVAELYGKILVELGLLSKGDIILKTASDFVGDVLGLSEKTTKSILKAAEGNVLVIDEAYSLYSGYGGASKANDPYKTAVIDTIVEQVQARPGADIAVVMLGYKKEMERMMANVNPGLSRRFQLEDAFVFPDFDDDSLMRILTAKARKQHLKLDIDVAKKAVRSLAKARARPNFGNGGAVDNILSKAVQNMNARDGNGELNAEDFGYKGDSIDNDALTNLFGGLIGCDEVQKVIENLKDVVNFSISQGRPPTENIGFNYIFLGSPGTGKTTVARRMSRMFFELGLLPSDEMKEIKASDLTTGYAGQAGRKAREELESSLGGCLFIDEAYQLDPERGGVYMREATDELVGALTEEQFKGKILVILAGYDKEMEAMLQTNRGLKSRFSERIHFDDFSVEDTVSLLLQSLSNKGVPLSLNKNNTEVLTELAYKLVSSEDFGNGRDVVTWADHVYKEVAKSHKGSTTLSTCVTSDIEHVKNALDGLLQSRILRADGMQHTDQKKIVDPGTLTLREPAPPVPHQVTDFNVEVTNDHHHEVEKETKPEATSETNLFDSIDVNLLKNLQLILDEKGSNNAEGMKYIARLDPNSAEFAQLVTQIQETTDLSLDGATAELIKWQTAQKKLQDEMKQQKQRFVGVRPLWRCAVCGLANKPYIVCHVAPYISGFQKVTTDS